MNPVNCSGIENDPVAPQWQSGNELADLQSIGIIDPNFGLSGIDWFDWCPSGRVALDWCVSAL